MAGKMIAVGDNVVDCYLDDHVYYPGGNAVNVAVNCRRDGIEDVAYIGMFGNDGKGGSTQMGAHAGKRSL